MTDNIMRAVVERHTAEELRTTTEQREMVVQRAVAFQRSLVVERAAEAIQKWQPVVRDTHILGALVGVRQRARARDVMVFGSPGPPGVALVVRAA